MWKSKKPQRNHLLVSVASYSYSCEFREYLYFIEKNQLSGKGLGFVDIHLLASAKLNQVPLWTADKKLEVAATELDLSYKRKI